MLPSRVFHSCPLGHFAPVNVLSPICTALAPSRLFMSPFHVHNMNTCLALPSQLETEATFRSVKQVGACTNRGGGSSPVAAAKVERRQRQTPPAIQHASKRKVTSCGTEARGYRRKKILELESRIGMQADLNHTRMSVHMRLVQNAQFSGR